MSSGSFSHGRSAVRNCVHHILLAASASLAASAALGADAVPAEAEGLEQVVITGTRLGQTGFSTPTPVTVLDSSAMERLGINNVGYGVNQLPSFRATTTPTTNGWGSFNVGAQIVNLRGMGVTRNLVLVDSRRFAPVTREGTADLNLIPSMLVKRIEVVTGGASAQYGSDAIAGVVNVLLDKDLNGLKGQADYLVTEEGDGDNVHVSLAGGTGFAGERGHVVLGVEYAKQDGIGDCFTRDYCDGGVVVTNTGVGRVNTGQPNFYRQDQGGGFIANTNGVINILNHGTATIPPTPPQQAILNMFGTGGVTFDVNGTPIPYTLGLPASGVTGAGAQTVSSFTTSQLEVPVERYATFAHGYFDFTENFRGFLEGSFGHVDGSVVQSRYFGAPISIFNDNPYVPGPVRAFLPPPSATPSPARPANGAAAFNLAVLGQRRGESRSKADAWRVTTGFDWTLNEKWSADAYYQYANTDRYQEVANALVTGASRVINRPGSGGVNNPQSYAFFAWATDPVYDPADAALPAAQRRIICRATISTDPALRAAAAGCVPFNPFGTANTSQAALDYVYRTLTENIDISQHVVAGNLRGDVAELWAGSLRMATGVEYRHDEMALVHDALSNVFAYFQNFGADFDGKQDVIEGYVEAELPLLRDVAFAKSLSLNAAVRYANYDISGFGSYNQAPASNSFDATTWKVGLVWEPLDWLRLRATTSEDLRAPNFFDMFQASASTFTPITNRFKTGNPQEFPVQLTGGNPVLGPETSHTTTVGLVLQPSIIPRFSLSLDYYDIKVDDYIATPGGAQNIVDQCALFSNQEMCGLITRDATQTLLEIRNVNVNLQWLKTRGLDIEAAYSLPLSDFSDLSGGFTFRLLATKTFENTTNLFGTLTDRVGETGSAIGQPDWLATLVVGYANGGFNANVTTRYISSGVLNALYSDPTDEGFNPALPNTITDNHVASATYFNLNGSWAFGPEQRYQVFAQVNNLFDKAPPRAPQLQFPSNPVYFDLIGRSYRAGIRFQF